MYGVARDVTERLQAETELREAEERNRVLAEEQAALRRVATLVARSAPPDRLFAAVTEEVGQLLAVDHSAMGRYDEDATYTNVASWSTGASAFRVGKRWPLEKKNLATIVSETGRPARLDDFSDASGPLGVAAREAGFRSGVAAPIVVEGRLWGFLSAVSTTEQPLPPDTEARLASFTELVATAIANAESREAVERLAAEQAALGRVATLVARGATPEEVFRAVAAEVGALFGSDVSAIVRFEDDGTATVLGDVGGPHQAGKRVTLDRGYVVDVVRDTSRSARFDTDDPSAADTPSVVRALGIRSSVASPIVVEGELWGAITAVSLKSPLPPGAERRLTEFTELVATAVANTDAREEVTTLVDEQAALRRVATLVAEGIGPSELFAAVSREVERVFGLDEGSSDAAAIVRFDPGPEFVMVGAAKGIEGLPLGSRWEPKELYASTRVLRTGRSARVDEHDLESADPRDADELLRRGHIYQVGSPIVVEGELWGAITINTKETLPADTEDRLGKFTELVATAIANAESGEARARLIQEQAALRRVATLVAEGVPPADIFSAVSQEVESLFRLEPDTTDVACVIRFDPGPEFVLVGVSRSSDALPVGSRWESKELYASTRVLRTGRSARVEESELAAGGNDAEFLRRQGWHSQIGSPIVVEGRPWGVIIMNTRRPLPPEADQQLARFTDLVATALANTESREAVARLAEEQAALRKVATLVARGLLPTEIFSAVAEEVGRLFSIDGTRILRYEPDGCATVIAGWSESAEVPPELEVGARLKMEGESVSTLVFRTGRPARIDNSPMLLAL